MEATTTRRVIGTRTPAPPNGKAERLNPKQLIEEFEKLVDMFVIRCAIHTDITPGDLANALDHRWGSMRFYFAEKLAGVRARAEHYQGKV